MSYRERKWVEQWSPFSGVTFAVHCALADIANEENDYRVWVSTATIARTIRKTERSVYTARAILIAEGFLIRIDGQHGPRGAATVELLFPDPQQRLQPLKSTTATPEIERDPTMYLKKGKKRVSSQQSKTEPPSYPKLELVIADPLPASVVANGFAAAREAMGR